MFPVSETHTSKTLIANSILREREREVGKLLFHMLNYIMFHTNTTLSHLVGTFYRWCIIGCDTIKALKHIYNESRKYILTFGL